MDDAFANFKGNMLFSSKNAFTGQTLSRRDDIISLVYLLVFLLTSNLDYDADGLDVPD